MSVPMDGALWCQAGTSEGTVEPVPQSVDALEDVQLVARAQTGDARAFEELVRRYRNTVYALAFRFVHNREEAWDLSQEVFVRAFNGLARFRGDASFKTWLMRITANQCKDFLKKRRLKTVAFDEAHGGNQVGDPGPAHAAQAKEVVEAVNEATAALSFKHRTAFVLREFEGLSYEEMAQVMKCSVGTVMSRLHYARKKIQQALIRAGLVEV